MAAIRIATRYDPASDSLVLHLENTGTAPRAITIAPRDYSAEPSCHYALAPGAVQEDRWAIAGSDHWYDLEARSDAAAWRFAGHCETSRASRSDPAIGTV